MESEEEDYYYEDEGEEVEVEKVVLAVANPVEASRVDPSKENVAVLEARIKELLEEIKKAEKTIADPLTRFKRMRDLSAQYQQVLQKIKLMENPISDKYIFG